MLPWSPCLSACPVWFSVFSFFLFCSSLPPSLCFLSSAMLPNPLLCPLYKISLFLNLLLSITHMFPFPPICARFFFPCLSTNLSLPPFNETPWYWTNLVAECSMSQLLHFSVSHCSSSILTFLPFPLLMKVPHYLCNPVSLSLSTFLLLFLFLFLSAD